MGLLQESRNVGSGKSLHEILDRLNTALQQRASEVGVPVGTISIRGAGDVPEEQFEAIMEQYNGLINRLAVPLPELPQKTE